VPAKWAETSGLEYDVMARALGRCQKQALCSYLVRLLKLLHYNGAQWGRGKDVEAPFSAGERDF